MRDNNEGKVRQGDRLRIPAAAWNRVIDASKAHARSRFNKPNSINNDAPSDFIKSNSEILVYNDTAIDLPTFGVMQLNDQVIDHALDPVDNNRRIALTGVIPTAYDKPIAIVQIPLASTEIGKAAIAGVTTVKVQMVNLTDEWANPIVGQTSYLGSTPDAGQARILWFGETGDVDELAESIYLAIVLLTAGSGVPNVQAGEGIGGNTTDCLSVTTVSVHGASAAPTTIRMLEWSDTPEAWISDTDFGDYGPVMFWLAEGRHRLAIGNQELYEVGFDKNKRLLFTGKEYTGTCDDYYVVAVECSECAGTTGEFPMLVPPVDVEPGETETITIPVVGIQDEIPPTSVQIDIDTPDGFDEVQLILTDPFGNDYELLINPVNDSPSVSILIDPVNGIAIPNIAVPLLGQILPIDNFNLFNDNPNGFWQLQVINNGPNPINVPQFQINFGNPPAPAQFVVVNVAVDDMQFQLMPELDAEAWQFQVDWGDGNVEWFQYTIDPLEHTYALDGIYDVIIRAYGRNGSYTEENTQAVIGDVTPGTSCATAIECVLGPVYGGDAPPDAVTNYWYHFPFEAGTYKINATGVFAGVDLDGFIYEGPDCSSLVHVADITGPTTNFTTTENHFWVIISSPGVPSLPYTIQGLVGP